MVSRAVTGSRGRQSRAVRLAVGVALATGALLAVGCGENRLRLETSPLLQTLQRKVGRIGYVGNDGNIYSVDQSGGRETRLTEDAGVSRDRTAIVSYMQPTWAPDDRRIAFARTAVAPGGAVTTSIMLTDWDGTGQREVFTTETLRPIYLYWSPDGRLLTLLSQPLDSLRLELGVVDVEQESYRTLDKGQPYFWSWLPDGSALLTHVGGDARSSVAARLTLVPLDPVRTKADYTVAPTGFQAPAISPDGRYMAYVAGSGDGSQLVVRELDGPEERVLTDVPGFAYIAYAPIGTRLAVLKRSRPGLAADGELSIIDARGGSEVTLAERNIIAFFWSPNGQRLAYLVPAQPDPEQGLVLEPLFARQPNLLYVELRVADADRGTSWRIVQFPISEAFLRSHLPYFDQYLRSASIWSPNGRYLTYSAFTSQGFPGVFVSAASGSLKPQFVARGDFAFWSR